MTLIIPAIGICFGLLGAAAERLASVWPPDEARRRRPGMRTAALAGASGLAAAGIAARSQLPWWATAVYLVMLAVMVVLVATDLEQRRLPHLLLDPLILIGLAFVAFNPGTTPLSALVGGVAGVAFLGLLGVVVRGGVAAGDLYLVAPIGLLLGFPGVFVAIFAAAFGSAGLSIALLATKRVGLKTYIPFGPFLVGGTVLALLLDPSLLRVVTGG